MPGMAREILLWYCELQVNPETLQHFQLSWHCIALQNRAAISRRAMLNDRNLLGLPEIKHHELYYFNVKKIKKMNYK